MTTEELTNIINSAAVESEVVRAYAEAIKSKCARAAAHDAIKAKWGKRGMNWINKQAWRILEKEIAAGASW